MQYGRSRTASSTSVNYFSRCSICTIARHQDLSYRRNLFQRRFLTTSKKQKRQDGKKRARDRRREKAADRNTKIDTAAQSSTATKEERIAREGVPDLNEIVWLALFPLLAAGAATAFIPEFRETLFGRHAAANTLDLKTRPLSLPGQKRGIIKQDDKDDVATEAETALEEVVIKELHREAVDGDAAPRGTGEKR